MPRDFFKDLAIYTILLPLPEALSFEEMEFLALGVGGGPGGIRKRLEEGERPDAKVKVLEAGVVGSLDYKIILAEEASALFDWLKENGYVYSGDEATLDFYVKKKWVFTVMKIDPKQMKKNEDGSYLGEVTPTRFTFASETCVYPLKITQISVKDRTDALFYVQSPKQMDLEGDLSWMHSWRVMWLTFMLGCGANEEQQRELNERNQWVAAKKAQDPRFETTKLEWARHLADSDLSVIEDPAKNYAQAGAADLPEGAKEVSREEFLVAARTALEKDAGRTKDGLENRLKELEKKTDPSKGRIVRLAQAGTRFNTSEWMWYPHREAPAEEVKGLARLKGHLQKGQWMTKFRKILRKDEMTGDLALVDVKAGQEQTYVRILPTSPP
jgi:hypothetical protein